MTEQRLIDANILSTSFGTLDWHCYNDCQNCNMKYGTCEAKLTMDDVLHNINSAPTIDAMPVVHAHPIFEYGNNNARCSNCNRFTIEYDVDWWDGYCSFCGAKMDEKGE